MSQSIEIISWNVNGIRAVASKDSFAWLENRNTNILCLQEIKATKEQIPTIDAITSLKETINPAEKKVIAEQQPLAIQIPIL